MGPLDAWIVYRFIRTLVTPWDETDAFKLGVIDAAGKLLVRDNKMTDAQKASYTLFHRLVFNIKRIIEKIPGGSSKIGTYAAALYLMREQMGDGEGVLIMERSFMSYLKDNNAVAPTYLEEQYLPEEMLPQGKYKIKDNMLDIKGDQIKKGTVLVASQELKPFAKVLGVDLYKMNVSGYPGKTLVVSHEDIQQI
jgi:hypothetical protein